MLDDDLAEIVAHTADPSWLKGQGLFVAEGRHVARRLLEADGFHTEALLLTPPAEAAMAATLAGLDPARRPRTQVVEQQELDRLTGFRLHQGCVAFARRVALAPWTTETPAVSGAGLSVLVERVHDPDNLGSIVRSAVGLGVKALMVGPECADPFYRKAVRTSMGAVFSLPLLSATPWPEVLTHARQAGVTFVAAVADPAAPTLDAVAETLRADRRLGPVVLMMGSEGDGLSPVALAAAQHLAHIPMAGTVDSLNVAVAMAIAVYALNGRHLG